MNGSKTVAPNGSEKGVYIKGCVIGPRFFGNLELGNKSRNTIIIPYN